MSRLFTRATIVAGSTTFFGATTVGFTGGFAAGFVVGFCALDAEDNKPTSASVLKMDKFFMSNNLYVIKQVQRTNLVR
jgi:ABC-type uncharacterized transport system permease subunit